MTSEFSSLSLRQELVDNLKLVGYTQMTPIQAQSLPIILSGDDIIAQGKTGSGKTAAFGLGLLNKLQVERYRVQSIVLCPTRELADQVAKEIRKLARSIHNIKVLTLCGGMPLGPQIGSLEHGAHIIVGTPGRIEEHLRKQTLDLSEVSMLVLDEADRMLDMGFQDTIDAIIECTPSQRQSLLFSATFPTEIDSIAKRVLRNPKRVKVESLHDEASIEQRFYRVKKGVDSHQVLQRLLLSHRPASSVIFCNTKRETQEVADSLHAMGFSALALHGDLDQRMRDQTLVRFANKSASILVATDVAARGLDIESLDAVINYEIAKDTEVHVHRIGRTGRAGSKGIALTLFSDRNEFKLEKLKSLLGFEIEESELPDESVVSEKPFYPPMVTLQIDGGKKQKVRPGDILGALTGDSGITGNDVGKIAIFDFCAYVAVSQNVAKTALQKLETGKLKGRSFRVRRIRG